MASLIIWPREKIDHLKFLSKDFIRRDEVLDSPGGKKASPKKSNKATPALKTPRTGRKALGLKTPKVIGKTPKVAKSVKKMTLWSEVVQKNLGKTPKKVMKAGAVKGFKVRKVKKTKVATKTPRKVKTASTSSTGHANSPETITITKKAKTPKKVIGTPNANTPKSPTIKTPKADSPKIRTPKAGTPKVKTPKSETPKASRAEKMTTPETQVLVASAKKSSEKRFPKRLSHVGTHAVLAKSVTSTPENKHLSKVLGTPRSARAPKGSPSTPFLASQLSQSLSSTPGQLNVTDFDFESQQTPAVPLSALVSPLSTSSKGRRGRKQRGGDELTVASLSTTPIADYTNVAGIRKLMKTPGLPPKSPMNDLTNVAGVKGLMRSPREQAGPKNDLSDMTGVKKILATPKVHKQHKDDLTDVQGVKKLMATPKLQRDPKNDLSDVKGVKKMMATPKAQKGPKNDLTDVAGVKQVMATPKAQKDPKNDLSDVTGVKQIMATPKVTKGPRNELEDLRGVKSLVGTPKTDKGPRNELDDLRGVKETLGTPKPPPNTPVNDLSDLRGVKQLVDTPRQHKEGANVLEDLRGVKSLLKTPKPAAGDEDAVVDFSGVADLVATPVSGEPSTSTTSSSKRKTDSSLERSSSKKARAAEDSEASTSRVVRSPTKSPTKTARGTSSPGVTIPKFDLGGLENQENIAPEEANVKVSSEQNVSSSNATTESAPTKRGRGKKVVEPVAETKKIEESSTEVQAEVASKEVEEVNYEKMLKKDLLGECIKRGIEMDNKSTKAVIITALRASQNAQPTEVEEGEQAVEKIEQVGRGRKGRPGLVQQEQLKENLTPVKKGRVPVVMEEEKEKEERIVTPVKTTRGKKVLQDVPVDNEQVPTDQKPRRGRGKKAQEEIVVVEEEKVKKSEESSSQRRRGARKVVVVEEVKEAAEPVAPVEDPASPVLKTSAQPKRGAKKGKGKVKGFSQYCACAYYDLFNQFNLQKRILIIMR